MKILENQTAVITGAARGIGRDLAVFFAENGANIGIIDIREQEMSQTAGMVEHTGRTLVCLRKDVRIKSQMEEAASILYDRFHKIDILVTCAGIGQAVDAINITPEDWSEMINTNLSGTFYACQAFGKIMQKQRSGKIILIGSKSGIIVNQTANHAHYNASKAGVIHLAKCLAAEWAPFGIYVNCISPGYILTPMTEERVNEHKSWAKTIPLKRIGLPEDLRGAALYLATNQSDFTTGANMIIDGGYTIW